MTITGQFPDEAAWAKELSEKIAWSTHLYRELRAAAEMPLSREYAELGPELLQREMVVNLTEVITQISLALHRMHALKGLVRDGPLPDLMAALNDLQRGLRPYLLQPVVEPADSGGFNTRLDMVRLRAVASVYAFVRSGLRQTPACKRVGEIFTAAGHRGRKGGSIGKTTVHDWVAALADKDLNPVQHRLISTFLKQLPPETSRAQAESFAHQQAAVRL